MNGNSTSTQGAHVATTALHAVRSDLDLLALPATDLDDLYRSGTVGSIPTGIGRGTAVFAPGRRAGRVLAKITALTAWQGKVIDDDGSHLVNLVSPFRLRAIRAEVYEGESWLDQKRCIVIDYSKTSLVARWVHDEIREVAPGVFLGLVYLRSRRLPLRFVLDFTGR
jgi:hypothetical protein